MRLALVALAMAACAPAPPAASPPPAPASSAASPDGGTPDHDASPLAVELPALDALAARAPALARGMHEVARGDVVAPDTTLVHAEAADTCVRVIVASDPPAHVQLRDTRGDALVDTATAADTPLGPRGPVCVRKGDAVVLHVEPPAPRALHYVAWASP